MTTECPPLDPNLKVLRLDCGSALPVPHITHIGIMYDNTSGTQRIYVFADTPNERHTVAAVTSHEFAIETLERVTREIWDSPIRIVCGRTDDPLHHGGDDA